MPTKSTILSVQTGATLDGGRRAIITVGSDQKPGSLAEFRAFLEAQGLKASPGYDEGHLLRIRDFRDDRQLRNILTQYASAHAAPKPKQETFFDPKTPFLALDKSQRQPFRFNAFIRKYSTSLVGLTSLVGGTSFLAKDILSWRGAQEGSMERSKAGISAFAAGLFVAASTSLAALGFSAARKPSATELIRKLEPKLNMEPDAVDLQDHRSGLRRSWDEAKNNPWIISTVFNALGTTIKTTGHAIPTVETRRNPITLKDRTGPGADRMELAGSASAFASLGLIATANSSKPASILGLPSFEKSDVNDPLKRRYERLLLSPTSPENDKGTEGHLNMKAAGFLAMASNAVFGLKGALDVYAGVRKPDKIGKKTLKSWPLMLVLPFNLMADYLTTISKPRFVYSVDELASEAAAYIAKKLDAKTAGAEAVAKQIFVLSELLDKDPRVNGNSHQLREAIAGRLHMDYGYDMLSNREGVQEYQHLYDVSPFTQPKPKTPVSQPTMPAETTQTRFAEKLDDERKLPANASLAMV